ncbi:MAG TPA: uroporphyrinogen decarboxylase family protein [Candidatus Limnocylindrales bacterium]|nr:uroporphyrinogen decarboxylase family protein [Candidatus Limnocylindrales bacterium]
MPMTSRERVLTALAHEEPDRVPIVLGVSNATGIKMGAYRALRTRLGMASGEAGAHLYDWPELGTAAPDEAILRRLHVDVRGVLDLEPAAVLERNRNRPAHSDYVNSWGSGAVEIAPGEWFPMVEPLADARTIEAVETYPWPDMDDPSRVAHMAAQAAALAASGEHAIVVTPWLLFPLERAFAMQGMDRFLMNVALEPEFAAALLRRITDLCIRLMDHVLEAVGPNVDIVKIGDDLGTQQSLLMSPAMYRSLLKPLHAELIGAIRRRTSAKVLFHSDGDVFPLIDDLVEIGVDILNPIQTSAGRMSDLATLKERYGKLLAFCGGVDTQRILPHARPAEVAAEVRRVIDVLGPGGGYLLSSVHTVMNDVPADNILAMVDAAVAHRIRPAAAA